MQTLTLVKFKDLYFPFKQEDFDLLDKCSLGIFQIPEETLNLLKATTLKKFRINVVPWTEVFQVINSGFLKKLRSLGKIKEESISTTLVIYEETSHRDLQKLVQNLNQYLGRYCFRCKMEFKEKPDGRYIAKLQVGFDHTLNPSYFYGSILENQVDREHTITLSKVARLVFTHTKDNKFRIEFQDEVGGNYVTAFQRSFDLSLGDYNDLNSTLAFFLNLTSAYKRNSK